MSVYLRRINKPSEESCRLTHHLQLFPFFFSSPTLFRSIRQHPRCFRLLILLKVWHYRDISYIVVHRSVGTAMDINNIHGILFFSSLEGKKKKKKNLDLPFLCSNEHERKVCETLCLWRHYTTECARAKPSPCSILSVFFVFEFLPSSRADIFVHLYMCDNPTP